MSTISGTRLLAVLATIASIVGTILGISDPATGGGVYVKWVSVIVTALIAGVTAAIQLGLIPEFERLKKKETVASTNPPRPPSAFRSLPIHPDSVVE